MLKQPRLILAILIVSLCPSLQAQSTTDIRVYQPSTGYLGINIRDVGPADVSALQLPGEAGVYIERVEAGSPAAQGDLHPGDVVIGYAGISVLSVRHFRRLVEDTPPGRLVELSVVRGGETTRQSVTVGKRRQQRTRRSMPRREFEMEKEFRFPMGPEAYKRQFFIFSDRPRLGIQGSDLTQQMGEFLGVEQKGGVLVMEVMDGSPAQRADLQAGDVITAVDGDSVANLHDLTRRLSQATHELEIVRRKKIQSITVHLGDSEDGLQKMRL